MKIMKTSSMLAIGASLSVLAGGALAHDHTASRGRLVFADHRQAKVQVLDLDSGEVTHTFEMPKPNPALTTSGDGRYTIIKTGDDADTVRFLATSLSYLTEPRRTSPTEAAVSRGHRG
jgi:hypothetical protein